ncbi:MAG TPA: AAA family ATPase, partial [Acidimicrobiia bacterium]|nr:AAA family ATPase [Acidimicrobiia bacterium]
MDELVELQRTFEEATADGRLRVVLVAGEAGVGKTSMVARAAARARDEGASVLFGECTEGGSAPYQVWVGALTHALRHCDARTFSRLCAAHAGALRRLLPAFDDRLPVGELIESDAERERQLMMDAVVALLEAVSQLTPMVLVLDDLQWIDTASLSLLRHLVRASTALKIVIFGTYRSSEVTRSHLLRDFLADLYRQPGTRHIELTGLIENEIVELLEAKTAGRLDQMGLALVRALHRDTGGNPFFVVEVLRHLDESGAIVHDDSGHWFVTGAPGEIDLPASVRSVVEQRVARLGDDAVLVLSAAAVIGQDFDVDVLGAVTEAETTLVLDVLDAAVLAALVAETPDHAGAYRFAHALVQQTLYQQTSAARRRQMHSRAAEALSDLANRTGVAAGGAPSSLNGGRLAVHYELAGRPIDAIAAYRGAAIDALSVFALDESIRMLQRALDLTQELPPGPSRDELELGVRIELGVPLVARDGYGSAAS